MKGIFECMYSLKDETHLVVKSNTLTEAFFEMTQNEYKLILFLMSKLRKEETCFSKQKISAIEFAELLSVTKKNTYSQLIRMQDSLAEKNILIVDLIKKTRIKIPWFGYIKYLEGEGMLETSFNPYLTSHLLNIDIPYTKYLLSNIKKLSGIYVIRLYELLKQYEKIGTRTIYLDELKKMLGISETEYSLFGHFKNRVLLFAKNQISKKTDIQFEFEEIKEGKKVVAIKFIIKPNDKSLHIEEQIEFKSSEENKIDEYKNEIKKIINDFNSMYNGNLDYILTKNLIKSKGIDCVKKCVKEFSNFVGNAKHVERVFYDFTMRYGTDRAYVKSSSLNNYKPVQSTNYEQREYSDEYFNSLYDNVEFVSNPSSSDEDDN
jgi:plasmid replication initiation protein